MVDWSYDAWPAVTPNWHTEEAKQSEWDEAEFHVDLGCGTVKKGRIGVDHYPAPGVNVVMNLDSGLVFGLPEAPGEDAYCYGAPGVRPWGRFKDAPHQVYRALGLPFIDDSIVSIISHHCLEHVGDGFIPLLDDIYRVLKPGGIFRAITPLFPSASAVSDPDHRRYFMEMTWESFCGHLGDENNPTGSWLDSFSVPYTKARFKMLEKQMTPRCEESKRWGPEDHREIRVTLEAVK